MHLFSDLKTLIFSSRAFSVSVKAFLPTFLLKTSSSSSCSPHFESLKKLERRSVSKVTSDWRSKIRATIGFWLPFMADPLKMRWIESLMLRGCRDKIREVFCERRLRNPDSSPGSLLPISIGQRSEVGNKVFRIERWRARCRVDRFLCCYPRDTCFSSALIWADIPLVTRSEGMFKGQSAWQYSA